MCDDMVYLIGGATHTGKTLLAQRLLEKYHFPYLSIDHLKMGLIRSGNTNLTVLDDDALTEYLWPIVREIVKTVIENHQNLIIEGCYIPFDWHKDFSDVYLRDIRYRCLVMSRGFISAHFSDICKHAGDIEKRLDDSDLRLDDLILENERNLALCRKFGCTYVLIDADYNIDLDEIIMDRENTNDK